MHEDVDDDYDDGMGSLNLKNELSNCLKGWGFHE
jgi:hypothetical protein